MVKTLLVKIIKKCLSSCSWGHTRPVLHAAHQWRDLLQSLLESEHPARGAPALCAPLLQRPHQVRGSFWGEDTHL